MSNGTERDPEDDGGDLDEPIKDGLTLDEGDDALEELEDEDEDDIDFGDDDLDLDEDEEDE